MKGIHDAGEKVHKNNRLRLIVQRTLVFSSYPGDFNIDIMYAMLDAFSEKGLKITNPTLNLLRIVFSSWLKCALTELINGEFTVFLWLLGVPRSRKENDTP